MKEIPLTKGKIAIVDDIDFDELSKNKWYAYESRGVYYAGRTIYKDGKGKILQMHIKLIGKKRGLEIDHINRNGLDNRRCNLRFVSHSVNCFNRRKLTKSSSKYVGVSLNKNTGKWFAYIKHNGKLKHFGSFSTEEDAYKERLINFNLLKRKLNI